MEPDVFRKLVLDFEKDIIIGGIAKKVFSRRVNVPVKRGKLSYQKFGRILGDVIDTRLVIAIDYYGHIKKSLGFLEKIKSFGNPPPIEINSYLVHFASVKMEDVATMTNDVRIMINFPRLKSEILILRGFRERGKLSTV